MTSMKKATRVLALAAALGMGLAVQAEALPIISVNPSSHTVLLGDNVSVDIVVTDLGEATGGFFLLLSFDNAVFAGVSSTSGPLLGATLDFGAGFVGGVADLDFVSLESVATLTGLQGPFPSTFVLATVNFNAIADGTGSFAVTTIDVSNNDGTALLPVCIEGQVCNVPEPGLLALMTTGLATLVVRRRARRQQ